MNLRQIATAAFATAAMLTSVPTASACGGFFCSQTPIDQTGERVLFGVNGDTVTAHIQIFYAGEAEDFAWVLPLPTKPSRIGVGTDTLFQQLEWRTRPSFNLQWKNQNDCWLNWGWGFDEDGVAGAAEPNASAPPADNVQVLDQGQVGPYDFVVIEGDSGEAVFNWLKDNDFEQPAIAKDLISDYVNENHKFVAVKLQSDASSGEIQPLVLDFPFPGSCVPLRLTSIAAQDDMDVWVYMLGNYRAVPVNYLHVEVNEKAIDWINYGSNYRQVAADAVDTASGRAFLTEYAGDTNDMKSILWQPGMYDTDKLATKDTPWDFVQEMLVQNFPRNTAMQVIIRKHIPKPESLSDLTDQQFYNNLEAYASELSSLDFDPIAFVADIEDKIFAPLAEANQLFDDFRYMTRMYTIMSPAEMTRDPIFLFNPDLPNVDRNHSAIATPICKSGENEASKVVVTLEDGTELKYNVPEQWAQPVLEDGDADVAAAGAVERMYTSGQPEPVDTKDVPAVDKELDSITLGLVTERPEISPPPKTGSAPAPAAGCTVTQTGGNGGAILLALAAIFGLLFRRRQGLRSAMSPGALVVAAAVTGFAPTAEACGGFFCNNTPVVQRGERVVFGIADGVVTSHVQVFYQGEAEEFAWVLPVPAEPTVVGVGTDQLFTALDSQTRPQFQTQWMNNGNCYFWGWGYMDEFADRPVSAGGDADGNKVQVLQEDSVGPYDYVVIQGKSGEAVFTWLNDNGYQQPETSKDLIGTYVEENHLFVAVKLQNDKAAGDIQPITLQYPFDGGGCVPLRLTSIAASDDMDVWVYMLGQHRAVPLNYLHVEIDETQVDWLRGGSNYKDLAREAVDVAAGRAFLTEYAGDTNSMQGALWQSGRFDTSQLLKFEKPWEMVQGLLSLGYPRTPQMQQIIRTHIPKPASLKDLTDQEFYNNLQAYEAELADQPFSPEKMAADIEDRVLGPLMEADALFDQFRYMTRMYTVISADEMLRDPIFQFNADLPNVSNIHRAIGKPQCEGNSSDPTTVTVTLSSGEQLVYEGPFDYNSNPTLQGADEAASPAKQITRMMTSGAPEVVAEADVAAVDKELDGITMALVSNDRDPNVTPPRRNPSDAASPSAGCTTSNSNSAALPTAGIGYLLLLSLGLLAVIRERV